jgi:hypothetical protein
MPRADAGGRRKEQVNSIFRLRRLPTALEHFLEKWAPVFRKKMRQLQKPRPLSDSLGSENGLALPLECPRNVGCCRKTEAKCSN